jgi:hypothetical protein
VVAPTVVPLTNLVWQALNSSSVLLSGGKLFTYQAGTVVKQSTYTDNTGNTAQSNPIVLNSSGYPTNGPGIWLIAGASYKFVLSPSTDGDPPTNAIWTLDQIPALDPFDYWGGTSTGSANAYALANPQITAYAAPFKVSFIANFANTGPATLNINALGNKNIYKQTGAGPVALIGGEIQTNQIVEVAYDGTQLQLIGYPAVKQPTRTVLTSGTAQTYTTPAGALRINARIVGGGSGGAGATGNNGNSGTNTTFGALTAGNGGGGVAAGAGGAGGTATGGDINIPGGAGGAGGQTATANTLLPGGNGANSAFGGGGGSGPGAAGTNAAANSGSGGGGGGGNSATNSGGGGGAGGYVEKLFVAPAATYTYTVGASGSGGAAGTNAGGNGAAGIIIVDEYYF